MKMNKAVITTCVLIALAIFSTHLTPEFSSRNIILNTKEVVKTAVPLAASKNSIIQNAADKSAAKIENLDSIEESEFDSAEQNYQNLQTTPSQAEEIEKLSWELSRYYTNEDVKKLATYKAFPNTEVQILYMELLVSLGQNKVNPDDIQNQISTLTELRQGELPSQEEILELYPEESRPIVESINQKMAKL